MTADGREECEEEAERPGALRVKQYGNTPLTTPARVFAEERRGNWLTLADGGVQRKFIPRPCMQDTDVILTPCLSFLILYHCFILLSSLQQSYFPALVSFII